MAAEKTFSRINAGKSMLFLGRFIPAKRSPGRSPQVCLPSQTAMFESAATSTSGLVLEVRRRRAECPDPPGEAKQGCSVESPFTQQITFESISLTLQLPRPKSSDLAARLSRSTRYLTPAHKKTRQWRVFSSITVSRRLEVKTSAERSLIQLILVDFGVIYICIDALIG